MSFWKRLLVFKLCVRLALLSTFAPLTAYGQAVPVAEPSRVTRAVSGVLQDGMRSRGFAANDPRIYSTLSRITPVLGGAAGTAVAVTAGTVTAPAWASVALVVGIGAIVSYAVTLGLDALVRWLFNPNGTVDQSSDAGGAYPDCTGSSFWRGNVNTGGGQFVYGCNPEALVRQVLHLNQTFAGTVPTGPVSCSFETNTVYCTQPNGGSAWLYRQTSEPPVVCVGATYAIGGSCQPYSYALPQPVPTQTGVPLPTAISAIPAQDLDKPLNPAIVAALANQAWQQAASQPGYDGLPYPVSNPITATEVLPWMQANPEYAPTVRDFVAPNPVSTANPQPWALPSNPTAPVTTPTTQPNPSVTNPAAQNPLSNLGPDPGIPAPQLEPIPTAAQIVAPILDLLPGHRNFAAAAHAGECPTPVIELYGSHTLSAHCYVIEQNKAVIQAAAVFAWAALALFIVLSA